MKSWGSPFDFNQDGILDSVEQALEMQFFFEHIYQDGSKRSALERALKARGLDFEDLEAELRRRGLTEDDLEAMEEYEIEELLDEM